MAANRIRLAVAALAVAVPLVAAPTAADAPSPGTARAGSDKQERTITIRGVEPRDDVFFARGRVRPRYRERPAVLQRKRRSADRWREWRTFRTDDESRFRERIAPLSRKGVVCYRVRIRGHRKFEPAVSDRVCIRTT